LLSLQNPGSSRTRLVTLTEAGGSGKIRLGIQVANDLLASFRDGVWFVDLSPLTDPALIAQNVAVALGAQEQPESALLDTLLDYLRGKESLLILDNCEQVTAACAELVQTLFASCRRLQILATSANG
jgi:non-specific serine/threonine protein kinase